MVERWVVGNCGEEVGCIGNCGGEVGGLSVYNYSLSVVLEIRKEIS